MIVHLVLFKFRSGFERDHPQVRGLIEAMNDLPGKIPQIRGWKHGFNFTADAQAWDYALHSSFDSEQDLHAYFEHPAHLPVVAAWDSVADLAFADFSA